MDKSREQFEQWVINENKLRLSAHDNPLKRCAHSYHYGWVSSAWEVWQASRTAIEIELQKPNQGCLPGDYHIGYDSGAESQYESDVDSIRAVGIKVKE